MRPGASAIALKQWSQLHSLSIQCLDMSTDSRVTKPLGATVADHSTYAARAAAGVLGSRQAAMSSRYSAKSPALSATTSAKVEAGGDRGLLRGHLTDLGFPACAVAAQHHRAGRGPEVLATLDGTGTAEHGDPVTASGLVAGEDQRVVARVREQEGTAEGGELAHGIRDPQPEPGPAQADGVPAGEGGLHGPLLRRPAEDRGIRGPRGVHQRAIALGLQCEHPVEAVAVRDKVHGVGRGVCRPTTGERLSQDPRREKGISRMSNRTSQPVGRVAGSRSSEGRVVSGGGIEQSSGQSLTAPAVTPAATYRWATTSRMAVGMEATTAVAIRGPHSWFWEPM